MNAYQLTPDNKEQEKAIINEILINKGCQQQIMHPKHKHNPANTTQKTKWATSTYPSPDTRTITKLFRSTNLKIAYKTTNSIKHLKPKSK
jgi:hypothetical protein